MTLEGKYVIILVRKVNDSITDSLGLNEKKMQGKFIMKIFYALPSESENIRINIVQLRYMFIFFLFFEADLCITTVCIMCLLYGHIYIVQNRFTTD